MIRMSLLEVEVNRLNVNFIRTNNEKIELVVVLIILGILGLHYTFIAQPQEAPKDQQHHQRFLYLKLFSWFRLPVCL